MRCGWIRGSRTVASSLSRKRSLAGVWTQWRRGYTSTSDRFKPITPCKNDTIYLAMSGGVDSAVAALILSSQEYKVHGIFMRNWLDDENAPGGCESEKDYSDVQKTCETLGIACSRLNLESEYWSLVFQPALDAFAIGDTPNPDVTCNRHIKFGALYDHISRAHANSPDRHAPFWLATGHYAQSKLDAQRQYPCLKRAKDKSKDQSFYLSTVRPSVLSRCIFPIGDLLKTQVKQIASQHTGLQHVLNRSESMGLCFVSPNTQNHFSNFLSHFLDAGPDLVKIRAMPADKIVGEYPPGRGLWNVTIGERSRFSFPGPQSQATRGRWYVCHKDIKANEVWICQGNNNPLLYSQHLRFHSLSLLDPGLEMASSTRLYAQIHPHLESSLCRVQLDASNQSGTMEFVRPQRAVTPGQSVALYLDDDVCVGGAIIASRDMIPYGQDEMYRQKY